MFGIGQLYTPKLVEIVGEHGGFDALWLDAEHAGLGMKEIELATMAARYYGLDHFVRQPATDYASIMRSLEAGAGGVMISMARGPEEAEQAVRWAKFHPRGERGMNGGNRDGRFGLMPVPAYVARANAETFVGIQLETARAIAGVAEIAAIPDVDLLFVGPADLSQVLGIPGDFENPRCLRSHREDRPRLRRGQEAPGGSCRGVPNTPPGCATGAARCSSMPSTSTSSTPASAPSRPATANPSSLKVPPEPRHDDSQPRF